MFRQYTRMYPDLAQIVTESGLEKGAGLAIQGLTSGTYRTIDMGEGSRIDRTARPLFDFSQHGLFILALPALAMDRGLCRSIAFYRRRLPFRHAHHLVRYLIGFDFGGIIGLRDF
jgi:hypothetical protein